MNKAQPPILHPSTAAMGSSSPEAPSDLELMAYFDGELEEPRRSIVAAFVGADLGARNKLAGMRITSAIVQSQTRTMSAADDIADLVFAKLAAEKPLTSVPAHDVQQSLPRDVQQSLPRDVQQSLPRDVQQSLPRDVQQSLPRDVQQSLPRAAANDNGRRIFAFAALAVAAAAAFAIWGRLDTGPSAPPRPAPVAVMTAPGAPASPGSTEPEIDAVAAVTPDGDMEHGVEVAAVNFGAHMGSIFYVPSDAAIGARPVSPGSAEAQRTTTVVWLTDDAGE